MPGVQMHAGKRRRKQMKNNRKGFTLAELLIVVAIIAVLVAIAIPVFTSELTKAKEAVDLANLRSAYAEEQVKVMTGEKAPAAIDTAFPAEGVDFQIDENWVAEDGQYNAAKNKIFIKIVSNGEAWVLTQGTPSAG